MGYQLGIDVGTTYTAAAVCRSGDRPGTEPEVVMLGTRAATIPSVLFVGADDAVVVGEAAARRALTDPGRVVREFKRRVGDATPIVVGGRCYAPEELSARLVRWVVDQVAQREGGAASRIALTHPASWGDHKKERLTAALAALDLRVTLLAEPQAAALHYATQERVAPGSTVAIYDLGGGTFDAAVVRKAAPPPPDDAANLPPAACFGLLGRPEGLDRLGGMDFDEAVFEHVRTGLPEAFAELDDTDPDVLSAIARVRRECTEAKEALSADTDASIPVLLPGGAGSVRLHRSEFEALIRPYLAETVESLRTAVTSAGCPPDALAAVLLVGGSSRIPLVAQMVSDGLGRPVAVDADPKNAIAKGAALSVSLPAAAPSPAAVRSADPAEAATTALAVVGAEAATTALVVVGAGEPDPGPVGPPPAPGRSTGYLLPPEDESDSPLAERRRPRGLLVGASGLLAVLVVLAAVLVPRLATASSPARISTDTGASGGAAAPVEAGATAAPAPVPAAAAHGFGATEGSGGSGGSAARTGVAARPRQAGGGRVPTAGGAPVRTATPVPAGPTGKAVPPVAATTTSRAQPPKSGGGTQPPAPTTSPASGGTGGGSAPAPSGGATDPPATGGTPPTAAPSGGGAPANTASGGSAPAGGTAEGGAPASAAVPIVTAPATT